MLNKPSYREEWERKKKFYEDNGIIEDERLFLTKDDENGGIDSKEIKKVIEKINELL
jgi:hypothetical protein